MNRRRTGFTLIELLVVVALISIMLVIAVPSFASFISNYRATSAINDILQAITQTRTEALKRGHRVTLTPVSGDWRLGWIVFVEPTTGANQVYNATDELIYKHGPLPSTMSVAGANNSGTPFNGLNYVIFDGTGYPRTAAGALPAASNNGIVITNNGGGGAAAQQRTLCIAVMGRSRVVKGTDPCTNG